MGVKVLGPGPATGEAAPRSYVDPRSASGYAPLSGDFWLPDNIVSTTTGTPTLNGVYWSPFTIGPDGDAINGIAVQVGTASAGGAGVVLNAGLYADRGDRGGPLLSSAGLLESGSIDITATGTRVLVFGATRNLPPGRFWAAVRYGYSTAPTTTPVLTVINNTVSLWATATTGLVIGRTCYLAAQSSLPTNGATIGTQNGANAPLIGLRAA